MTMMLPFQKAIPFTPQMIQGGCREDRHAYTTFEIMYKA